LGIYSLIAPVTTNHAIRGAMRPDARVLLGFRGAPQKAAADERDPFSVSFLGGVPTTPAVPQEGDLRCGVCATHSAMRLLMQVSAPLPGVPRRSLLVFVCTGKGKETTVNSTPGREKEEKETVCCAASAAAWHIFRVVAAADDPEAGQGKADGKTDTEDTGSNLTLGAEPKQGAAVAAAEAAPKPSIADLLARRNTALKGKIATAKGGNSPKKGQAHAKKHASPKAKSAAGKQAAGWKAQGGTDEPVVSDGDASSSPVLAPRLVDPIRLEFDDEAAAASELDLAHENDLLRRYEEAEGKVVSANAPSSSDGRGKAKAADSAWEGEEYEDFDADKVFTRFQKVISWAPEQIVRYYTATGCAPLVLSADNVGNTNTPVPPCSACGSRRMVEMQILPSLLTSAGGALPEALGRHVEFGIVTILCCEEDCTPAKPKGLVEEHVHVQPAV
jgi:Programmed cell death protein 2, C-terminal putative domain